MRGARLNLKAGIMKDGPIGRALDIAAIIAFVLLLIAAVNALNWYIGLLSLASLGMIWGGNQITVEENLGTETRRETPSVPLWVLISLFGFIMLDIVVPPAWGFLDPASSLFSGISPSQIFSVEVLIVILNSVSEEDFFRKAIANLIAVRLRAGPWGAVLGSAVIFALAHSFVDAGDFSTLAVIFGIGIIITIAGIITGLVDTCKLAHLINDAAALGVLAVFHPDPSLMLAVVLI